MIVQKVNFIMRLDCLCLSTMSFAKITLYMDGSCDPHGDRYFARKYEAAERGLATRDYMQALSTEMQRIRVQLVDTIIIFMVIDIFAVSTQ